MKHLLIEIADTPSKRETGLMKRKVLSENEGMLFKFPYPQGLRFWMKDTYIPLDIAFVDDDGTILQIEEMYPRSTRTVDSNYYCRMALEVNHGWFKKNSIKVGDVIAGEGIDTRFGNTIREAKVEKPKGEDKIKHKLKDKPKDRPKGRTKDVPPLGQPEGQPEGQPPIPPEETQPMPEEAAPQTPEQVPPDVKLLMNSREKIKYADQNKLPLEIIYVSESGKSLPPRKLYPVPREGYPIRNGLNGEYFVGFDVSPTIRGKGYDIPGNTIKNWLFSGIMSLEILEGDLSQKPKAIKGKPKTPENKGIGMPRRKI